MFWDCTSPWGRWSKDIATMLWWDEERKSILRGPRTALSSSLVIFGCVLLRKYQIFSTNIPTKKAAKSFFNCVSRTLAEHASKSACHSPSLSYPTCMLRQFVHSPRHSCSNINILIYISAPEYAMNLLHIASGTWALSYQLHTLVAWNWPRLKVFFFQTWGECLIFHVS